MNTSTIFLEIINNLPLEIKDHIEKMGLPYPLVAYADSSKNISEAATLDGTLVYIKFQAPEKDLNIYPYLE